MSLFRKATRFLKGLFVTSAISPLFVSVQSTLPGPRQPLGSNLSICDEEDLKAELDLRGIVLTDEDDLWSLFNTGLDQILSPDLQERRMASETLESLAQTLMAITAAFQVDLGVAYALSNRPEEGLEVTMNALESLGELSLLETDMLYDLFSTTIIDNEAEIRRRLERRR